MDDKEIIGIEYLSDEGFMPVKHPTTYAKAGEMAKKFSEEYAFGTVDQITERKKDGAVSVVFRDNAGSSLEFIWENEDLQKHYMP